MIQILFGLLFLWQSTYAAPIRTPEQIQAATVQLVMPSQDNGVAPYGTPKGGCSGFFVSDDGYLLTARHCLEALLTEDDYWARVQNLSVEQQAAVFLNRDFEIGIRAEGIFGRTWHPIRRTARVVATGADDTYTPREFVDVLFRKHQLSIQPNLFSILNAYFTLLHRRDPVVRKELMQLGARMSALLRDAKTRIGGVGVDWAVLKIESYDRTPCIPMAQDVVVGQAISHFGFPGPKGKKPGSAIELAVVSSTIDGEGGKKCLSDWLSRQEWSAEKMKSYKPASEDAVSVLGKLYPGMSGGPAVNDSGEWVGINAAIAKQETGCDNFSFINPVNQVREQVDLMSSKLGTPNSSQIFNCRR